VKIYIRAVYQQISKKFMRRKAVIIRIPERFYRKLKRVKNKTGTSINFIILSAITKYLSRKNEEETTKD